jgi:hypothetical protein
MTQRQAPSGSFCLECGPVADVHLYCVMYQAAETGGQTPGAF